MDTHHFGSGPLPGLSIDDEQLARLRRDHHLEVAQKNGWLSLTLSAGRQRGMAALALVLGLACLIGPLIIPESGRVGGVISIALGCFGLSLLMVFFYLPFNVLEVQISRRKVKRIRSWFGVAVRSQEVRTEDLQELLINRGQGIGPGTLSGPFDLVGRGSFGRLKIVENFPDRSLLEAIHRLVTRAAGLRPSGTH